MAVRVENRLTFVHIGKCGGISLTNLIDEKFNTTHSAVRHDTYDELPEEWKDCVFCIIRNPFDRLLSLYYFSIKKYEKRNQQDRLKILDKGFENYVMKEFDTPWYGEIGGWRDLTQAKYFPADKEKMQVLRLENLNEDWRKFCMENNLPYYEIGRANTTRQNNSYRKHYTDRMIEIVKDKWAEDIRLGDYEF